MTSKSLSPRAKYGSRMARRGQDRPRGGSADVFPDCRQHRPRGRAGVLVQRRTLPEAEEQSELAHRRLMFRDQSLEDAIAEFNRYNMRKIVIQDPAIASLKIEGNFRATNVEAFVRLLESGFPVRVQCEPIKSCLQRSSYYRHQFFGGISQHQPSPFSNSGPYRVCRGDKRC